MCFFVSDYEVVFGFGYMRGIKGGEYCMIGRCVVLFNGLLLMIKVSNGNDIDE